MAARDRTGDSRWFGDGLAMGAWKPCNRKHNPQPNKQMRKRNGTKRAETKRNQLNKQTMKRKRQSRSGKSVEFSFSEIRARLCAAALFSALTPQNSG
ncbi:hypothetical protein M5D96_003630 [Drosophila gunungcola]|uniref:Uncharacterized protein n=1 Tax=Drosophila gunungcola TaxID=103775 RepID=A0A9P9YSL5_9MUSC|nr:hypothetical protein M5D96_003630 [Drosophila gunungcola]